MAEDGAPYHAHIYFDDVQHDDAAALREAFQSNSDVRFIGRMARTGIGPHPIPQFEIHFSAGHRDAIIAIIERSGLRALVHPLTNDDLADHTTLAHWIGDPLELDLSVLDPPGENKGVPRFGVSDFD